MTITIDWADLLYVLLPFLAGLVSTRGGRQSLRDSVRPPRPRPLPTPANPGYGLEPDSRTLPQPPYRRRELHHEAIAELPEELRITRAVSPRYRPPVGSSEDGPG